VILTVKVLKIDHLGIAVKNLDEAIKFYKDVLGLELVKIEEVPQEKVKIAMFKIGETHIELLEATSPDSAIAKFIEKKGEGIHHIALRVDDITKAMEELKSKGARIIYDKPREVAHGERIINFIHPKSAHGVLLEIVERRKEE